MPAATPTRHTYLLCQTGSDLVDVPYTPLFSYSQNLKIISAAHVTSDSGTGLVHCAPAHGGEDYRAFLALNLLSPSNPMICHVNGEGKFTAEVANVVGNDAAASLVGQDVLTSGSKVVIELLKKNGNLVKVQRIKHRYPYDWKTNEPIIMTYVLEFLPTHIDMLTLVLARLHNGSQIYPILKRRPWRPSAASRSILLLVSFQLFHSSCSLHSLFSSQSA